MPSLTPSFDQKLPIEVLQGIYSYLCLRDDYFEALATSSNTAHLEAPMERALSQVSSYWRSAALAYPPLWAVADWMEWPLEKLRLWAKRGALAGLSLHLAYSSELDWLSKVTPLRDDLLKLVLSMRPHWRLLSLKIFAGSSEDKTTLELLQPGFDAQMLHSLFIDYKRQVWGSQASGVIEISSSFAPNLRELATKGDVIIKRDKPWEHLLTAILVFPLHSTARPQLVSISCCVSLTVTYVQLRSTHPIVVTVFKHLEHLNLNLADFKDALPLPGGQVSFPSLKYISLHVNGEALPPANMFSGIATVLQLSIFVRTHSAQAILQQLAYRINHLPSSSMSAIDSGPAQLQLPKLRSLFLWIIEANPDEAVSLDIEAVLQEIANGRGTESSTGTKTLSAMGVEGISLQNVETLREAVPWVRAVAYNLS